MKFFFFGKFGKGLSLGPTNPPPGYAPKTFYAPSFPTTPDRVHFRSFNWVAKGRKEVAPFPLPSTPALA